MLRRSGARADAGHAGRQRQRGQRGAAGEGLRADALHAGRDSEGRKGRAAGKGAARDIREARGQRDRLQGEHGLREPVAAHGSESAVRGRRQSFRLRHERRPLLLCPQRKRAMARRSMFLRLQSRLLKTPIFNINPNKTTSCMGIIYKTSHYDMPSTVFKKGM